MKVTHFQSGDEVKLKTVDLLLRVSDDGHRCFEERKIHMQQRICRRGEYVEGDRN
jgi:hypothetical protein